MRLIKNFLIVVAILAVVGGVIYLAFWDVTSPMRTIVEEVSSDMFDT